ncbi:hypothetical protein ACFSQU_03665 [Massilia sp. GCM10020059]|uniref:Uncharacterized protein n=1 Tax=Massilia agrisoli TaxID=2892444 RepID=A0ABS8IPA2_9BURK|nr:hypothetical protein [Massilia agrisoli]MCC6070013.1 hypothetical protein [Massilia agrisoli]
MNLQHCIAAGLSAAALALPAVSIAAPSEDGEYLDNCACHDKQAAPQRANNTFGAPAEAGRLDETRGGDGGTASDTRLSGTVTNNSATNVATGSNIIQSGSFANASGVPIVIQNTGANVLIQNATVINLQLK